MSNTQLDAAQRVVKWIQDNNGFWNSDVLEIKPSKLGGVGVFAKTDIDPLLKPVVLLRLHKESILSSQKSVVANLIIEEGIEGALALIISFLYEKQSGESSPWSTFINTIQYHDSNGDLILPPALWTKKQKQILKGTELDIMGALDDQENQQAYERACTFALSQHELSNGLISIPWELDIEGIEAEEALKKYKTFIAISHAIASRDFEIDEFHQVGLVPGACLFNHSNKPTVRFESLFDVCGMCGTSQGCDHIVESDDDDEDIMEEDDEENEDDDEDNEGDDDAQGAADDDVSDLEHSNDEHDEHEHGHSHSHGNGHGHGHEHDHGDGDDCCGGSDDESESEEEFDGPIEEFIDLLEENIAKEKEVAKELENDDESDSDLELEEQIVILDDDKPVLPDDCCDIALMKKVQKGEELFNTYGDFSNSILLSKYGFVIPDNTNDTVGLGLQFLRLRKKNQNLYSRHFDWWEKEGHLLMTDFLNSRKNQPDNEEEEEHEDGCTDGCCGGNEEDEGEADDIPDWTIDVSIDHSGAPTPITYALLKLLSLNKLELTKFLKNPEKINLDILTTKSSHALKIYKELVEQRSKEYNAEIKLNKLLKSSDPRERMAAVLVSSEKSIVSRALEYANKKV